MDDESVVNEVHKDKAREEDTHSAGDVQGAPAHRLNRFIGSILQLLRCWRLGCRGVGRASSTLEA